MLNNLCTLQSQNFDAFWKIFKSIGNKMLTGACFQGKVNINGDKNEYFVRNIAIVS